jgi:hypothetical protein
MLPRAPGWRAGRSQVQFLSPRLRAGSPHKPSGCLVEGDSEPVAKAFTDAEARREPIARRRTRGPRPLRASASARRTVAWSRGVAPDPRAAIPDRRRTPPTVSGGELAAATHARGREPRGPASSPRANNGPISIASSDANRCRTAACMFLPPGSRRESVDRTQEVAGSTPAAHRRGVVDGFHNWRDVVPSDAPSAVADVAHDPDIAFLTHQARGHLRRDVASQPDNRAGDSAGSSDQNAERTRYDPSRPALPPFRGVAEMHGGGGHRGRVRARTSRRLY